MGLTVLQLVPALDVGGVERGTVEIAAALSAAGHRALVMSAGGRLVTELENVGAEHIACPIGAKRLSTLRLAKTLADVIISSRVDIVHARSRLPAWIGRLALRRLADSQRPHWVTTVHGPYTVNRYSRVMTSGDRVIAISQFIVDYLNRHYPDIPNERIRLIHRGIDPGYFHQAYQPNDQWRAQWAAEFPQCRSKVLLVVPGRLTRWKGQQHFVDLVDRLLKLSLPVHGLIAGGAGNSRKGRQFEQELRRYCDELGISAHVTFLGARTDMRDVLAHADIAYSLTLEPEAFGRTTIEALGLGTPVIGYDHGGTGEILTKVFPHGRVPTGDIDRAVARSADLIAKPQSVPSSHPFTLARMQEATLSLYEELGVRGTNS